MANTPDTPLRRAMRTHDLDELEARRWVQLLLVLPEQRTAELRRVIGDLQGEQAIGHDVAEYVGWLIGGRLDIARAPKE